MKKSFPLPSIEKIEIDTSVSLLMSSTPPGNPGVPVYRPVKREKHIPFDTDRWESPFERE